MSQFYTVITAAGQAKIATAIATGVPLALTNMAVGDGNGNPITPTQLMTALVRERYRAEITNLTQDEDNANWLIAELVIPADQGGWTIHEAGLFDTDGVLIAVASFPATYKPVLEEGSTRELVVRIIIEVSATSAVTLIIDPTIVMASRQWVIDNYSIGALLPGGLTAQVLRKVSNTSGDVEWADLADANILVNTLKEIQTLADSQTIVDLAILSTTGLAVYVEGSRIFDAEFPTATRVVLPMSFPAGSRILCVQNDPNGVTYATETTPGFVEKATQAEVLAGTDDERYVSPLDLAAALAALGGPEVEEGYIDGGSITPAITDGAALAVVEDGTNDLTRNALSFPGVVKDTHGFFNFRAPSNWDGETIRAKVLCKGAAGCSAGDAVRFYLACAAVPPDGDLDVALGTAVTMDGAVVDAGKLIETAASAAMTPSGTTPAAGDLLRFRLSRDYDYGAQPMAESAELVGVVLQFGITGNVAAWA